MGRFARDTETLPASLDGAAERLQASIESYARGLLRGAEARASAIAEHAARRAEREAAGTTAAHAAQMLDAIDLIERRVAETFTSLKQEAEALLRGLEKAWPAARVNELRAEHDARSELDDAFG